MSSEDAVLFHQIADDVLLTSTEPAGEGRDEYLKRGDGNTHGGGSLLHDEILAPARRRPGCGTLRAPLALLGVLLGIAGAFAAVRLIAHQLYGIGTTDALTFTVVGSGLLIVTVVASYVPARRAASVDPLIALRYE